MWREVQKTFGRKAMFSGNKQRALRGIEVIAPA